MPSPLPRSAPIFFCPRSDSIPGFDTPSARSSFDVYLTMAPSTAALKPQRANKQPVKPVVPALPLTYAKRQAVVVSAASRVEAALALPVEDVVPQRPATPGTATQQAQEPPSHPFMKSDDANQSTGFHETILDANSPGSPGELP